MLITTYVYKYFEQTGVAPCSCDSDPTGALDIDPDLGVYQADPDQNICLDLGGSSGTGYYYSTYGAGSTYPTDPCTGTCNRFQYPLQCQVCNTLFNWTTGGVSGRVCLKLYCVSPMAYEAAYTPAVPTLRVTAHTESSMWSTAALYLVCLTMLTVFVVSAIAFKKHYKRSQYQTIHDPGMDADQLLFT